MIQGDVVSDTGKYSGIEESELQNNICETWVDVYENGKGSNLTQRVI